MNVRDLFALLGEHSYLSKEKYELTLHKVEKLYSISGMTCNGCKEHVQEALKSVSGVDDVLVNLEEKNFRQW